MTEVGTYSKLERSSVGFPRRAKRRDPSTSSVH
jgi:hypothetical protein